MAKIPLRTYIHEIETIIEQKQTEEAIAHCRHILLTYPKNIDTYRMLGKAYLESQRNSNAADIFQRLLSAVPDDFVSHVGMSIIREDENNLDAAIWHMERAFEGQPYNAAIQGELRRLFGLRDGMEPPKVHLTRGALARMYVKGDLHQQAIAELRSAIAEDPQRFDLQVSLGQMYANSGQDAKAIETCGGIISKLPYCLEANRILAQLLVSTDRSEEAKIYKQRVEELNPYQAYIGPNAPTEDRVPAQAVLIEQLIWDGGPAVATGDQPEWAASVGISLDDSRSVNDDLPDWMSNSSEEAPLLPASLDGEPEIEPDGIPDFMKEAGWGPSTGSYDESKSAFELDDEDVELETSEAVAGDIPDWLQQMAPPDEAVDELEDVLSPDESAPLDWLQDADIKTEDEGAGIPDWLAPVAAAGVAGAVALSSSEDDADVSEELEDEIDTPDWLLEAANAEVELLELAAEVGIPDWLQEIDEDVEISPETQGELPDWLPESLVEEDAATPMAAFDVPVAEKTGVTDWLQEVVGVEETSPEPEAELPDWLQESTAEDAATPLAAFDAPEAEKTGVTDWLQEVVGVEETSPEPEAELPDWLQEPVVDEEISPVSVIEPTEVEEEGIPDWLAPAAGAAVAASILSSDDEKTESVAPEGTGIPDWLQESAGEEEIEPLAAIAPPEAKESEIPDWLQGMDEAEEVAPEPVDEVETSETEVPDWLQESAGEEEIEPLAAIAPTEAEKNLKFPIGCKNQPEKKKSNRSPEREPPEAEEESEIPDWLQGMDEAEEVAPEPVDEGETSETEVPDWLQESAGDEEIEPIAEIAPTEAEEESEIPDWLQESAGEEEIEPLADDSAN